MIGIQWSTPADITDGRIVPRYDSEQLFAPPLSAAPRAVVYCRECAMQHDAFDCTAVHCRRCGVPLEEDTLV